MTVIYIIYITLNPRVHFPDFSFKQFQGFKLNDARNWAPFKINNIQYFVVAKFIGKTCPIYRYDTSVERFVKEANGLECYETVDLKPFKIDGVQHVVVANHEDYQPVVVWMWNGKRFTKRQQINITATYVEGFDVQGATFLAVSGETLFFFAF